MLNTQTATCVLFWYHMYGSDVSLLTMYLKTGSSLSNPYWNKLGTQGDQWHAAQVELGPLSNKQVSQQNWVHNIRNKTKVS